MIEMFSEAYKGFVMLLEMGVLNGWLVYTAAIIVGFSLGWMARSSVTVRKEQEK